MNLICGSHSAFIDSNYRNGITYRISCNTRRGCYSYLIPCIMRKGKVCETVGRCEVCSSLCYVSSVLPFLPGILEDITHLMIYYAVYYLPPGVMFKYDV